MFNTLPTVGRMTTTSTTTGPSGQRTPHVQQLVIGAGFAGLAAAIRFQEDGETDFLVVEKGDDVGGTWRDNTYPGAACDVPSQLYSYSFAPNPDWSMSFSPQPEIQAYIRRVAERAGVLDRFRFRTAVEAAVWDDDAQHWRVTLSGGEVVTATVLVSGSGGLSEPRMPDIDGIEDFGGEIFHSARWNHDVDLAGKRVAVIGTGASSIQIVPEVQQVAAHLDVYQRTAPYVIPRNDRRYTRVERLAFRHLPLVQKAYRTAIYWGRETYVPGFTLQPKLAWPAKKMALANIRKGISDPALR
jgi:cation diffusion facilitator CzcD-associated flavoprotein CzcO